MASMENICPRCGRPYSYIKRKRVGDKVYLYAVHYLGYEKVGGKIKKKTKECYLGPEESYEYVTRTHAKEGLVLRGLADRDRALSYLDALINYIASIEIDRELALRLADRFMRLARILRGEADPHEVKEILYNELPANIDRPIVIKKEGQALVLEAPTTEAANEWKKVLEKHGYKVEVIEDSYGVHVRVGLWK